MPEISRFFGVVIQMFDLMEDWNLARAEAGLKPIAPLE
jgi:hypothetical protein